MSGPKVVRIVTREELLEICNGQLARVDSALAEWICVGQRNECIDTQAIAEARRRRDALAALIASNQFMDLQKQAPVEEEFLRGDLQSRLHQIATEQAAARMRERREREAAVSLLSTLRADDQPLDANFENRLKKGDPKALAEGFALLANRAVAPNASRVLASKLRDECPVSSFAEWVSQRPVADIDPAVERLELRIVELGMLLPEGATAGWRARLDEAATAETGRRGLLLDGLEVETGRTLTELRRRVSIRADFDSLFSELEAAGVKKADLRDGIDSLDTSSLTARIVEARRILESHRETLAATARRDAVLKELSALGYEIVEGMDTIWARDGRLVVRSATRPSYGVEVSVAGGNQRMQMRAVAFDVAGHGPDTSRDHDAETIWCGDVSILQQRMTKSGGGMVIEKALPVGATPLKRIAVEAGHHTASEAPLTRSRSVQ